MKGITCEGQGAPKKPGDRKTARERCSLGERTIYKQHGVAGVCSQEKVWFWMLEIEQFGLSNLLSAGACCIVSFSVHNSTPS